MREEATAYISYQIFETDLLQLKDIEDTTD